MIFIAALVISLPLVLGLPSKRESSKCDVLKPVVTDLLDNLFTNECGDAAHGALRLVFHDAIGIDPIVGGGGADGSILIFNATELNFTVFPANEGLDDVVDEVGPFFLKHADVISPGDFVQLAGALSLAACPGAPLVKFFMGRPPPVAASPPNLVPEPFDDVSKIIARFASVNFGVDEFIALLSSHSVAGADTIDPNLQGIPFDSTPSVFDTNIFLEVLLKGTGFPGTAGNQGEVATAINGTLRLQSDDLLARDPRTACAWQALALNHDQMMAQFAPALLKVSLLGQNENKLTDCSELIPTPPRLNDVIQFPPQTFLSDIQQSCDKMPFPNLPTQPGPALVVPAIPQADDDS